MTLHRFAKKFWLLPVMAALLITGSVLLPWPAWLEGLPPLLAQQGRAGAVLFCFGLALALMCLIPGIPFMMLAGAAYGTWVGFITAYAAAVLAANGQFLLSRGSFGERIRRRLGDSRVGSQIIERSTQHGAWWVLLLRLSPVVPFAVLNYAMGLTRIRPLTFFVASSVGKVPSVLLAAHTGAQLMRAGSLLDPPSGSATIASAYGDTLYWVGILATGIAAIWLGRYTRKLLATPSPALSRQPPLDPGG